MAEILYTFSNGSRRTYNGTCRGLCRMALGKGQVLPVGLLRRNQDRRLRRENGKGFHGVSEERLKVPRRRAAKGRS